jgi:hypothetical protein
MAITIDPDGEWRERMRRMARRRETGTPIASFKVSERT